MKLQALGTPGKDAMILAAFLTANEWANMIGLYELSPTKLSRCLPAVKGKSLTKAFAVLAKESYAFYDEPTEFVWVREMARIRLRLEVGQVISNANALKGAQNLYQRLPLNPFLGPFYDRYHVELALKHRRQGPSNGVRTVFEGPSNGVRTVLGTASEVRTADQVPVLSTHRSVLSTQQTADQISSINVAKEQEQRPDGRGPHPVAQMGDEKKAELSRTPSDDGNFSVLVRLTHAVMDSEGDGDPTNPDIIEAVKAEAAKQRILYTPDTFNRALRCAGTQRVKGGSTPGSPLAPMVSRIKAAIENQTVGETVTDMAKARRR